MQFDVECSFYECMTMRLTVDADDIDGACHKAIEEANNRSDWRRCDWAGDTFVMEISRANYAESLPIPAEFTDPLDPPKPQHTGPAWSDADLAAMLAGEPDLTLPPICAALLPFAQTPILLQRGQLGYWPCADPAFDVDGFNRRLGINAAQHEAMQFGSMFGFDKPGADPRNWLDRLAA